MKRKKKWYWSILANISCCAWQECIINQSMLLCMVINLYPTQRHKPTLEDVDESATLVSFTTEAKQSSYMQLYYTATAGNRIDSVCSKLLIPYSGYLAAVTTDCKGKSTAPHSQCDYLLLGSRTSLSSWNSSQHIPPCTKQSSFQALEHWPPSINKIFVAQDLQTFDCNILDTKLHFFAALLKFSWDQLGPASIYHGRSNGKLWPTLQFARNIFWLASTLIAS